MGILISRREVLNNLIRFKDNLLEMRNEDGRSQSEHRGQQQKKKGRIYKVLLNRRTGDMRFAQKISNLEHHFGYAGKQKAGAEDWKEVHLIVEQKLPREVHFEVLDAHDQVIKPADLDPLAWRITKETIAVLNQKGKEVKDLRGEMLPEESILEDLSSIHISAQHDRIEHLPGWVGAMERIEAENILIDKPVGTYLLRDGDKITNAIAFHLAESNFVSVHAYVLTLVEKEKKISDILFLQTDKGWTHYADNTHLEEREYHYYVSPEALLHSFSHLAKFPVS
ncbi:MAG: SH2 domain-containing protein [Chlamydiota bacterium]